MTAVLEPLHIVGPERSSLDDPGSGRPRPGRGGSSGRASELLAPVTRTRSNSADNLPGIFYGAPEGDAGGQSQRQSVEVRAWDRDMSPRADLDRD